MMSVENYQDRTLTCRDCGQDFTFTVGEQEFYASRGLTNLPGRCPECRAARRSGGGRGQCYSARPRAEKISDTPAHCGKPTTATNFPPVERPAAFNECFPSPPAPPPLRRRGS